MFDTEIFHERLETYKKNFSLNNLGDSTNEWELIKSFQDNWDINAPDFYDMLFRSMQRLSLSKKFIYQFSTIMIKRFAQNEPEKVRKMFKDLYDEQVDIYTRYDNFMATSDELFEIYRKENETKHCQTQNAISVYLWLMYPDKYNVFKISVLNKAATLLDSNFEFIRGDYYVNIRNFYDFCDELYEEFIKDKELAPLLKRKLNKRCYTDENLRVMLTDFIFNLSK